MWHLSKIDARKSTQNPISFPPTISSLRLYTSTGARALTLSTLTAKKVRTRICGNNFQKLEIARSCFEFNFLSKHDRLIFIYDRLIFIHISVKRARFAYRTKEVIFRNLIIVWNRYLNETSSFQKARVIFHAPINFSKIEWIEDWQSTTETHNGGLHGAILFAFGDWEKASQIW